MPLLFALVFNDVSFWWVLPCLALGFGYAFWLYRKKSFDTVWLKRILFALRMLVVSLIAFLLLAPLFKTNISRLTKPVVFIAQDVSSSVSSNAPAGFNQVAYYKNLNALAEALKENYDVRTLSFGSTVYKGFKADNLEKETDITAVFEEIKNQNPENVGALILLSDGVYTKGANPVQKAENTVFPIYTVALGDTVAKRDLLLQQPNYNHLVYLGNQHEVQISVKASAAKGANSQLQVSTNDGQRKTFPLHFKSNEDQQVVKFTLDAKKKGIQKISLSLKPINQEKSIKNNQLTLYVDVIDGQEQILLLADAPHPDLSALRQAIESNQNYKVQLAFADDVPRDLNKFGLLVLHNLPSAKHPIQSININNKASLWFIVGNQTDISKLNALQSWAKLIPAPTPQSYSTSFNEGFFAFAITDQTKQELSALAPLASPLSAIQNQASAKILLKGKAVNGSTEVPQLLFSDLGAKKEAILNGEGIWRWRMDTYSKNNNFDAFDELISKSVQYLSAKQDKRKFVARADASRYNENEQVLLTAELYNDSYELVNQPEVKLELKDSKGKRYSYLFSRTDKSYQLTVGPFAPGEYSFTASTKFNNNNYSSSGNFIVEELNVEDLANKADHQLLYHLSRQSGASMLMPQNLTSLADSIKKNQKVKPVSFQQQSYQPLIASGWLFALILILLSLEWFLRKRNGTI
ncbi:hypothetical protein BCY91_09285 [Pelobium manganitolerans]|uniref:VWA domain-containing protein n=1 Tax=Pelobium manganitolerans TaxID=1842495 RepID=A0A419S3J8_9SPHI|nr:hypothetical protein [Pelobium manganitolerans]RKD13750.1 hypothetical protein BCY91_09285 [Pelobium manganitolerans]